MRRCGFLLVLLSALMPASEALAASNMMLLGVGGGGGGGGAYVGLGDISSGAKAFYGLRGYNAAYATGSNKAINIRRASDSTTSDILILSSGALDVATATTFCAATTCFITKFYDQSGALNCSGAACDAAQATTTKQPQLIFNCINTSLPCARFVGASVQNLTTPSFTAIAQPVTIGFAAKRTTVSGALETVVGLFTDGLQVGFDFSANNVFIYAGSAQPTAAATDNAFHNVFAVANSAASVLNVDGASTTVSPGVLSPGGATVIGDTNSGGHPLTADVLEIVAYPSALSGGAMTNLCHNQFTYWATSTSC
jgi:hypothetical protein